MHDPTGHPLAAHRSDDKDPPGTPYLALRKVGAAALESRLTHLDDVAVGVTDVAADLGLVLLGRRQELGAPGLPFSSHFPVRLATTDASTA